MFKHILVRDRATHGNLGEEYGGEEVSDHTVDSLQLEIDESIEASVPAVTAVLQDGPTGATNGPSTPTAEI